MPTEGVVIAQAIGHVPPTGSRPARCMFCEAALDDEGAAFIDHIARYDTCRTAYQAWLENLDQDRAGG